MQVAIFDIDDKKLLDLDGYLIELIEISKARENTIPSPYQIYFDFYVGSIQYNKFLFVKPKGVNPTPQKCMMYSRDLMRHTFLTPIFILEHDHTYIHKRLEANNVYYVMEFRHARLPIDLPLKRAIDEAPSKLSSSAQHILLYHLQRQSLEGMSAKEIDSLVPYKYTQVAHSLSLLESLGICKRVLDKAHHNRIHFKYSGRKLWEKSLSMFISPIKSILYCDEILTGEKYLASGESALCIYSSTQCPEEISTVMMHVDKFRQLRDEGKLTNINRKHGKIRVEAWNYLPLVGDDDECGCVDKLSLVLSLMDCDNHNIRRSAEKLLEGIDWKG